MLNPCAVVLTAQLARAGARWVMACQRLAWACCQHRRLGGQSSAFRLAPDLAGKCAASMEAPAVSTVRAEVAELLASAEG